MANDFRLKISADISEVEKGFKDIKGSLSTLTDKKLGINLDPKVKQQLEAGIKDFYKDLESKIRGIDDHMKKLVEMMPKLAPDSEKYRKANKELLEMGKNLSNLTKLKGDIGEGEEGAAGGVFSKLGKGVKGFGGGFLKGLPGGSLLGMGAAGLGLGLAAAIVGEGYMSYQERKQNVPLTVDIAQTMGAKKLQEIRPEMISRGGRMGFTSGETLEAQRMMLTQVGERNITGTTVNEAQRLQRGFGIDVSQTAGFLGAVRRGGGQGDTQQITRILTDAMAAGIQKADLPKYLQVISDAIESTALSGGVKQEDMAKALEDMAKQNELFRNNPQAGATALQGLQQLFSAKGGLSGAFGTAAMLGAKPGMDMMGLLYNKQITAESGIFGKGVGGIERGIGGNEFIKGARDLFAQTTKDIKDPRMKAMWANMIMPGIPTEISYDLLTNRRYGKGITPTEQKDIEKRINESKTLTNLTGTDFKNLMNDAVKSATRDALGGKIMEPMNKIAEFLNDIREAVNSIANVIVPSRWFGNQEKNPLTKGMTKEEQEKFEKETSGKENLKRGLWGGPIAALWPQIVASAPWNVAKRDKRVREQNEAETQKLQEQFVRSKQNDNRISEDELSEFRSSANQVFSKQPEEQQLESINSLVNVIKASGNMKDDNTQKILKDLIEYQSKAVTHLEEIGKSVKPKPIPIVNKQIPNPKGH